MGKKKNKKNKKIKKIQGTYIKPEPAFAQGSEEKITEPVVAQISAVEEYDVDQETARRDVKKILLTFLILAIVLTIVCLVNYYTGYLKSFGDWVYTIFRFQM